MKTGHGVIQGYNGVAAVDAKHRIVVHAEAWGQGPENNLLVPMLEGTRATRNAVGHGAPLARDLGQIAIAADSGFHSQATLERLDEQEVNAVIADRDTRGRDPRFADRDRYKKRHRKERQQFEGRGGQYTSKDFSYNAETGTCRCPAGHTLYSKGRTRIKGYRAHRFQGSPTHLQALRAPGTLLQKS
jgi:hypothetical protein